MAKKATTPLTPQQAAQAKAARIREIKAQMDALETEQVDLENQLRAYVTETNDTDLGALQAYRRAGSAKLVGDGLTPKELEMVKDQLANELPTYCKISLDVTKMFNSQKVDFTLANALQARGLTIAQETTWNFKLVKD